MHHSTHEFVHIFYTILRHKIKNRTPAYAITKRNKNNTQNYTLKLLKELSGPLQNSRAILFFESHALQRETTPIISVKTNTASIRWSDGAALLYNGDTTALMLAGANYGNAAPEYVRGRQYEAIVAPSHAAVPVRTSQNPLPSNKTGSVVRSIRRTHSQGLAWGPGAEAGAGFRGDLQINSFLPPLD